MILRAGKELERVHLTQICRKSHCDETIHSHIHTATDDWKTFVGVCTDGHESMMHIDEVYVYRHNPKDGDSE